jgi:AraC-like DNA-binding protein
MTETSPPLTETPEPRFDVVAQILDLVRLDGALFLRADFRSPWAYTSPPGADMAEALLPGAGSLVLFHIVGDGRCWIEVDGTRRLLEQGDVVVLPYADPHLMEYPAGTEPVSITELLPFPPWIEFPRIDHGGDGEHCLIVCGYLQGDAPLFDPLLRALPAVFVVRPPAGPAAAWVSASIEYALMASERNDPTARRNQALPELLFAEVLRIYLESGDAVLTGLLAALRDPVVGHALTLLHADPAREWSVGELASEVAVSKTVLVDRFGRMLGRPPIKYLTDWRLSLASGLLRTTQLPVGEIGARVGYNSEESFSRAFKRELGTAPAHWRAEATEPPKMFPAA